MVIVRIVPVVQPLLQLAEAVDLVVSAQAGTRMPVNWIPACAGMTNMSV